MASARTPALSNRINKVLGDVLPRRTLFIFITFFLRRAVWEEQGGTDGQRDFGDYTVYMNA
jgi:hypothetical protein